MSGLSVFPVRQHFAQASPMNPAARPSALLRGGATGYSAE